MSVPVQRAFPQTPPCPFRPAMTAPSVKPDPLFSRPKFTPQAQPIPCRTLADRACPKPRPLSPASRLTSSWPLQASAACSLSRQRRSSSCRRGRRPARSRSVSASSRYNSARLACPDSAWAWVRWCGDGNGQLQATEIGDRKERGGGGKGPWEVWGEDWRLGQRRGACGRTSWRSRRISASKPCTSAWESSSSSAFSSLEERRRRGLGTRHSQPLPRHIAPMPAGLGPSAPSPFTAFRTHSSCRRRRSWALALASCRAKWCEGPSRGVLAGAAGTEGAGSRSSSSSAKRCGRARVRGQKEPILCPSHLPPTTTS